MAIGRGIYVKATIAVAVEQLGSVGQPSQWDSAKLLGWLQQGKSCFKLIFEPQKENGRCQLDQLLPRCQVKHTVPLLCVM